MVNRSQITLSHKRQMKTSAVPLANQHTHLFRLIFNYIEITYCVMDRVNFYFIYFSFPTDTHKLNNSEWFYY